MGIRLWVSRYPTSASGWTSVSSVEAAKEYLKTGDVEAMSLEYDLGHGVCKPELPCEYRNSVGPLDVGGIGQFYCNLKCTCPCHVNNPTGYDLLKWAAAMNFWPKYRPLVFGFHIIGKWIMNKLINETESAIVKKHIDGGKTDEVEGNKEERSRGQTRGIRRSDPTTKA